MADNNPLLKPNAVFPLVTIREWDELSAKSAVSPVVLQEGYVIGLKSDGSYVAVPDVFAQAVPQCQDYIEVNDADTEEEFLKNAEKAWLEKHGAER